jgi:hypothetical protein
MGNHRFRTARSDPQEADPPCPILNGAILGLTTLAPFGFLGRDGGVVCTIHSTTSSGSMNIRAGRGHTLVVFGRLKM